MKKKVLTLALVVALVAIMVSGTLAYFTDNDAVTNTFTIGSVLIEIFENDEKAPDDTLKFEEALVPVVAEKPTKDDAGYIPKVVDVKNTGANAAYIRVHIAQPKNLLGYLELDLNQNTTEWKRAYTSEMTLDGQEYIVVTFDYLTAVDPDKFTSELLKGAYLASDVDLKANKDGDLEFCKPDGKGDYTFSGFVAHTKQADGSYVSNAVNVLVYAQAIQAQGFSDAASALDSGFGTGTNPWQ